MKGIVKVNQIFIALFLKKVFDGALWEHSISSPLVQHEHQNQEHNLCSAKTAAAVIT